MRLNDRIYGTVKVFPIDSLTSFGIKMSDNFGIILGMSPKNHM